MSSTLSQQITIGRHLSWVIATMDQSDRLIGMIPEDKLHWRAEDPAGLYMFSLAELGMHIADARLHYTRQLSGDNSQDGYWSLIDDDDPLKEQGLPWSFRTGVTKQSLLDSLAHARAELQPYLDLPLEQLQTTTTGTRSTHDRLIKWFKSQGIDTAEHVARGPATINRVLFAIACHEAGHRGSLQTLMRLGGIDTRAT